MLIAKKDRYNGLILELQDSDKSNFKDELSKLIQKAKTDQNRLLWFDLTTKESKYIAIALDLGFEFHNCEANRTTLIYKLSPEY